MPVGQLLCEGADQGPDATLLNALIGSQRVRIKPIGAKYGLGERIVAMRELQNSPITIAAIRDCDFDFDPPAEDTPGVWYIAPNNQRVWLGWHWARVELENYLVDPMVVARTLGLNADQIARYREGFAVAAATLADYTAARYTLSRSRLRGGLMVNRWGVSAGLKDHVLPPQLDAAACEAGIAACLMRYRERLPAEPQVMTTYEQARIMYSSVGPRGQRPEIYSSGKDLLCMLSPTLGNIGLGEPGAFRRRMLNAIQNSLEPIWDWLPEWQALHRLLQSDVTNAGP